MLASIFGVNLQHSINIRIARSGLLPWTTVTAFFLPLGAMDRVIFFSSSASFFLAFTIPLPPLFCRFLASSSPWSTESKRWKTFKNGNRWLSEICRSTITEHDHKTKNENDQSDKLKVVLWQGLLSAVKLYVLNLTRNCPNWGPEHAEPVWSNDCVIQKAISSRWGRGSI